ASRSLLGAALLASGCSSTTAPTPIGEFTSPTGITSTSAGDRDLVFIANTARDGLRALQLCKTALLADGGVDPADTCPAKEHIQFIPGPIRVFAATIETENRPVRLAGARLIWTGAAADAGNLGVALAVGADDTMRV